MEGYQPLARKINGSWYYYIYNAHGDVVGLVNDAGTVVNTYEYTPWGEIRSETETVDNPIKYAGEYYDDELDMYYLRARYYNPKIGRFTSLDIEEGEISNPLDMNRYVYCRNNPTKYIDPSGESIVIAGVTISAATVLKLLGVSALSVAASKVYIEKFKTAIALGKTIYDSVLYAKGGKQNIRSSEFQNVTDEELEQMYKDPNTSKAQKLKIKKEQKGRKSRHSSQKK